MPNRGRNILVFHAGALGDFVLTWPLGLALGRMFPQSRIIYVSQKQKGELAEKVLRLESMDVELGWHHLFGDAGALPEVCRKRLQGSNSIYTYVAGPNDAWVRNVATIAPQAQIISIDARPPAGATKHASHYLLQSLADHSGVQTAVQQILSSIAANGIASAPRAAEAPIAIHPGSGSREKCWPAESFLQLTDALQKAGRKCRVILGEVELERWPAQSIQRFESAAEVSKPKTYIELLGILQSSSGFVGNDSGPGHLAGIIGLPTISLFGPSDPAVWKPLGPRVHLIRNTKLQSLIHIEVEKHVLGNLRDR